MKKKILGTLVVGSVVAMLAILASPAESKASETSVAQDTENAPKQNQFQLGLISGPGFDSSGAGPAMSLGGHLEYKVSPLLGLGVFGMYTGFAEQEIFWTRANSSLSMFGAEAKLYPFSNDGLYVAGRLGMSVLSTSVTAEWDNSLSASNSQTGLLLGGAVGYNFHLGKSFSLGPELAYFQPHVSTGHGNLFNTMMTLNYGL